MFCVRGRFVLNAIACVVNKPGHACMENSIPVSRRPADRGRSAARRRAGRDENRDKNRDKKKPLKSRDMSGKSESLQQPTYILCAPGRGYAERAVYGHAIRISIGKLRNGCYRRQTLIQMLVLRGLPRGLALRTLARDSGHRRTRRSFSARWATAGRHQTIPPEGAPRCPIPISPAGAN